MVHRSDDALAARWTSSWSCCRSSDLWPPAPRVAGRNVPSVRLRLVVVHDCRARSRGVDDRCRLSLTSAAGSGRRRWTTDVTCRGRRRPEAESVDGRRHLSLASTAEDRRRRWAVLPDDYGRRQKASANSAPSHWWLQARTEASTDRVTYRWRLPVSTTLIADDYWSST